MIDRPVAIVGPMRSGGAMVAQVVHRLGWHAGHTTWMPQPPTWRLDMEDPELSNLLVRRLWPTVEWWGAYLLRRRSDSEMAGFGGRFLVKCPYLALCWEDMLAGFGGVKPLGCPSADRRPFVIRTFRDRDGLERSMAAHPALSVADQEAIRAAAYKKTAPDSEICYDWAVESPEAVVRVLAGHLGQEDDATIRAAVALIGSPTAYHVAPVPV